MQLKRPGLSRRSWVHGKFSNATRGIAQTDAHLRASTCDLAWLMNAFTSLTSMMKVNNLAVPSSSPEFAPIKGYFFIENPSFIAVRIPLQGRISPCPNSYSGVAEICDSFPEGIMEKKPAGGGRMCSRVARQQPLERRIHPR